MSRIDDALKVAEGDTPMTEPKIVLADQGVPLSQYRQEAPGPRPHARETPPPLRPVETLLAARPDRSGWDHWLYRAQPQLDNNAGSKLDVVGTAIEIRVGDGGTITNVSWRFRALTGQSTSSPSQSLEIANDEDGNPRENRQIYVLDGDGVPQYYLSPYHIVNVEDEYALVPACAHSLVVELGVIARDDGSSDVTAVTMGGSGNYEFNWGFYTYDDPWLERGVQDLGSGDSSEVQDDHKARLTISTINVPSSAGVIMVNVRDRSTGAFKHHAQPLFGYPKIALTAPEPESEPVA